MKILHQWMFLFFFGVPCGWCFYDNIPEVIKMTATEFDNHVKHGNDVYVVQFYSPTCGRSKAFAPEYQKAANIFYGFLKFAATKDFDLIDVERISGFPTVRFYVGGKRPYSIEYYGPRTASDLVQFLLEQLHTLVNLRLSSSWGGNTSHPAPQPTPTPTEPSPTPTEPSPTPTEPTPPPVEPPSGPKGVEELTDASFSNTVLTDASHLWFIAVYSPESTASKLLLPIWDQLAQNVPEIARIGRLDGTTNPVTLAKFNAPGYPTLDLFPYGEKSFEKTVRYEGTQKLPDFINFVESYTPRFRTVSQLTSQQQFKDHCTSMLCVLAFLPPLKDSSVSGRREALELLNGVLKREDAVPFQFFWLQGGDNPEFEKSLQLNSNYPRVAAVHLEKEKYGVYQGPFKNCCIVQFVTNITKGLELSKDLPKPLPNLNTVEEWQDSAVQKKIRSVKLEDLTNGSHSSKQEKL